MSHLHNSKQYDLISYRHADIFNEISRYLDDIFTIYNPEFEKHIPDIYQTAFQLNKAKTSDKETSFLDFKVAYTSGPIFKKNMKRYPIFSVQIINYQIDQKHK